MKTKSCTCTLHFHQCFIPFFMVLFFVLFCLTIQARAAQEGPQLDFLEGDEKSACEAILCLSSPTRPSECAPSLAKYFSINLKKWSDTLKARKNFLNLCPSASAPEMPSLIDAISNGAGFCDAGALNMNIVDVYRIYTKSSKQWSEWRFYNRYDGYSEAPVCTEADFKDSGRYNYNDENYSPVCIQHKQVIDSSMPSRCLNLINNALTDFSGLVYEGDMFNGGKWVTK